MMAMKMNLQFYMRTKKMSIKHKIKFKKIDRDRGTYFANGISLDLSDDGQPSDDSRRSSGESTRRSVSQNENEVSRTFKKIF